MTKKIEGLESLENLAQSIRQQLAIIEAAISIAKTRGTIEAVHSSDKAVTRRRRGVKASTNGNGKTPKFFDAIVEVAKDNNGVLTADQIKRIIGNTGRSCWSVMHAVANHLGSDFIIGGPRNARTYQLIGV